MDRGDWGAARSVLRRARRLLPEGSDARAALGPTLALALAETGEMEEATLVASEAAGARDPVLRARGVVAEAELHSLGAGPEAEAVRARSADALGVLERAGDDLGIALYWRSHGYEFWGRCRSEEARDAWERALFHAQRAEAERIVYELHTLILSTVVLGPTPASEAIGRAQRVLESSREGSLREAAALRSVGVLLAFEGRMEEARTLHARAVETFRGAGLFVTAAGWSMSAAWIERRAGDGEAEERLLREGCEALSALSDRYYLPTVAIYLADAVANRSADADPEVDVLCAVARERTISGDLVNFVGLDWTEARMLARRGRFDEAVALARRGLESADTTDLFDLRSKARLALAEVLSRAGEREEVERLAEEVLSLHELKGDVTGRAWARRRLDGMGIALA
jgi:tetratricopeptide (TPR) repeat protein